MELLLDLDKKLLLFFNKYHNPWVDQVMYYMTNTYAWIPLHALLLYMTWLTFGRYSWVPILLVVIAIGAANTITSEIMKPLFMRLRPTHEHSLKDLVHIVNNYRGGLYGFASSHAANTFALATFFFMLLKTRYRYIGFLFLWASFVTYTRIYLGVHYPGDILIGGGIGILCGWVCFLISKSILKRLERNISASGEG